MSTLAQEKKSIFPIKRGEWSLFLTGSLMMILTLYIYSVLRNVKDILILSHTSAELLSTIKLYGVLPSAVIFMVAYTKLADMLSRLKIYYSLILFFAAFFVIFAFFLQPNLEAIKINTSALQQEMPYLKYLLIMVSYWPYTLFYIMAELWGSVMLALMFWQLANQVVSIDQAKRFYPLFGFLGQIGLLLSGVTIKTLGSLGTSWEQTLDYIILSVIASTVIMCVTLAFLSNFVVAKDVINGATKKKNKPKIGLIDSFKYVFSSRYIGLIALLVICYGISINLLEGVWKKKVELYFVTPHKIGAFFADVQIYTAIFTDAMMIFALYMLRKYSWKTSALMTPIMIAVTGILFFIFVSSDKYLEGYFAMISGLVAFLAVLFGGAQSVLSKATKYALFDSTKEMTYIPLDEDLKAKGKAAADVVGGRLGKSGGAIVQWGLLTILPSLTLIDLAPSLFVVFVLIIIVWFVAVNVLAKDFKIAQEKFVPTK